jgi:hypothetical protein
MNVVGGINRSLVQNPLAWILFAMFAIAEYGNWHRGHDLSRICELVEHGVIVASRPVTPLQEIDAICGGLGFALCF